MMCFCSRNPPRIVARGYVIDYLEELGGGETE